MNQLLQEHHRSTRDTVIIGPISEYMYAKSDALVPLAVITILICAVGIIGNFLVLFVITSLKEYSRSATHWYILQLAIADSLFLLTIPFKVSQDLNNSWIYPEWMCKAKETILFLNYYASILFLVVMSVDRYIAVCKTFSTSWQKLRSRNSAFIITIVIWVVALLLTTPIMLYSFKTGQDPYCKCGNIFPEDQNEVDPCLSEKSDNPLTYEICKRFNRYDETSCVSLEEQKELTDMDFYNYTFEASGELSGDVLVYDFIESSTDIESQTTSQIIESNENVQNDNERFRYLNADCHYVQASKYFRIFLLFNFTVMFLLPLLIMVICYGLIIRRLFATRILSSLPQPSFTSSGRKQDRKRKTSARTDRDRKRVTFMCAALVSSFVICWLPYHSLQIAKISGIYDTETEVCRLLFESFVIFVYLNSALNPYLYSFLGSSFSRRWSGATSLIRRSVSRRKSSLSGSIGGSMKARSKQNEKNKSLLNKTTTTKLTIHQTNGKNSVSEYVDSAANPASYIGEGNTLLVLSPQNPTPISEQKSENCQPTQG